MYKHDVFSYALECNFDEFLKIELGRAYECAADYYNVSNLFDSVFGRENVKILLFEDFLYHKTSFFKELSQFLNKELMWFDIHDIKKNVNVSNFITLLYRQVNKFSQKNPDLNERKGYIILRKMIDIINIVYIKFKVGIHYEILNQRHKELIRNKYKTSNKLLAEKIGKVNEMKKYGYF